MTFPLSKAGWSELYLYVYDAVGDNQPIDIYFFSAAPAAIADNQPLTISAADLPKLITGFTAINFTSFATGSGIIGFVLVPVGAGVLLTPIPLAGDAVYVYLVMNSTASLTATDGLSAAILAKG